MGRTTVAFMSYAHADDENAEGAITRLAQALTRTARLVTGDEDFAIFFDRDDIEWGDRWRDRIGTGLDQSCLLIPVLSPSYFRSDYCRRELEEFVELPERVAQILPIYFIDADEIEQPDDSDALVSNLRAANWVDWRQHAYRSPKSMVVQKELRKMAARMNELMKLASSDRGEVLRANSRSSLPADLTVSGSFAAASGAPEQDDVVDLEELFAWVSQWLEDQDYGLARAVLADALERERSVEVLQQLAIVDWYDGALEQAVEEFSEALMSGGDVHEILMARGQALIEMGDYETGISDLREVLGSDLDSTAKAYARSGLALGLAGLGAFEEAALEFARAERVTPRNAWLHFNRAVVEDWQGDRDAARRSYLRALRYWDPALNRSKRVFAMHRVDELDTDEP